MKMRLKDFLTESDAFQEVANTYLAAENEPVNKKSKRRKKIFQKVFNAKKWLDYLEYAKDSN